MAKTFGHHPQATARHSQLEDRKAGRTSLGGGSLGRQRADEETRLSTTLISIDQLESIKLIESADEETRGWVAGGVDEGAVHRGAGCRGEEPGLAAT